QTFSRSVEGMWGNGTTGVRVATQPRPRSAVRCRLGNGVHSGQDFNLGNTLAPRLARRRIPERVPRLGSQDLQCRTCRNSAEFAVVETAVIVRTFRNLEAWQSAMDLAVACYEVARRLPSDERFVLGSQIRRAAISVPSNIAEGHATRSDGTLLRHLRIARGSLGELETQLELLSRLKLRPAQALEPSRRLLTRTQQLLAGLARTVR